MEEEKAAPKDYEKRLEIMFWKLHVYPAQINRAIKGGNDPKSIEIRMKIYRELGMNE